MKTIYEHHPVTPERKADLRSKGYRILDARFAPKGYENPEGKQQHEDDPDDKPMTIAQIKVALAEKGIEIPEGVTKRDDLKALLDSAGE